MGIPLEIVVGKFAGILVLVFTNTTMERYQEISGKKAEKKTSKWISTDLLEYVTGWNLLIIGAIFEDVSNNVIYSRNLRIFYEIVENIHNIS